MERLTFSEELFSKVCKIRKSFSIFIILLGVSIYYPFLDLITRSFSGAFVSFLLLMGLTLIVLGIIGLVRNDKKSLLTGYTIGRLEFQDGILEYHKDIIYSREEPGLPDYVEDRRYEINLENIKSCHKSFYQNWIIRGDFQWCVKNARKQPFINENIRKCSVIKIPNYYEGLEDILITKNRNVKIE